MIYSVRCTKCGLIQLPNPICKACGTRINVPQETPILRSTPQLNKEVPSVQKTSMPPQKPAYTEEKRAGKTLISFHGRGGTLFEIWIINMFLTIGTLGIYHFWGKVKIRKYLFSETEFEGDRFAYHGTGKELLVGSLKALLLFFIPIYFLNFVPILIWPGPVTKAVVTLMTYGIIMVFIPVAMVGARRYRLSRTSWRGIRFSFRGKTWDFLKLFLWGSFITVITLGIYNPFFETKLYHFMVSHSYFGNRKFHFDGNGRELLKTYLLALLLSLPTLGFYWFWYLAKKQRFFWEHTSFGSLHFHSSVTGRALLNFHVANLLILLVTLGFGWPWIIVRSLRFMCKYLSPEGVLDLAAVEQEPQTASATGEVLSGFLDTELNIGIG